MQKLTDVVGDQRVTWHLAKELLHSDDKPPDTSPQDASKLCDGFVISSPTAQQGEEDCRYISHLRGAPSSHWQPLHQHDPCLPYEMSEVTVVEFTRLIGSIPPKSSPIDFMPTLLLKSTVHVMAPLSEHSFNTGMFPSSLKQDRVTPL